MRCATSHSVVTSMVAPAGLLAVKLERHSSRKVGMLTVPVLMSTPSLVVSLSSSVMVLAKTALTLKGMPSSVFQPVPFGTTISPTAGPVPVAIVITHGLVLVALTMSTDAASMSSLIMMTLPCDEMRMVALLQGFGMALTAASISFRMVSRKDWMALGAFEPKIGRSQGRGLMPPRFAVLSQRLTALS